MSFTVNISNSLYLLYNTKNRTIKLGKWGKLVDEKKIWHVLEIDPTKDENSIKEAYRRKLVHTNPEDDEQGFKLLRECYEKALILARMQEEAEEETPVTHWMSLVRKCYNRISQRTSEAVWQELLSDELCVGLDSSTEVCEALLTFLMDHYYLPQKIWQMIATTFCLVDIRESLYEILPHDFIDYVIRKIDEEDFVDLMLLEGDDEADYDDFIKAYYELKNLLDQRNLEEAQNKLDALEKYHINHPLVWVEQMRFALYKEDLEEAKNKRAKVLESQFEQPYGLYFVGICYWECDEKEEAGKVWEQILESTPTYYWAKYELIKYYMYKEDYNKAKEYCLDVLEEIGGQEKLVNTLAKINEKLLEKLEEKWQSETEEERLEDEALRFEIGWCYFQNKRFEACEKLLQYEPSSEYEFEFNNLKGRNYLADSKYKEALPYLHKWLELCKGLQEDGTEKTKKRIERKCYAFYTIGFCYKKIQKYDEAVTYFEEGATFDSSDAISCKEQLAEVYLESKAYEKCIDTCNEIIDSDKNFYPAYLHRQKAYYGLKDGQNVINDFYHCYHIFPGYYEPYVSAMKVFINFNQFEDAIDIYNKAKENNIDSATLEFYKVQCTRLQAENQNEMKAVLEALNQLRVEADHGDSDIKDISEIDCEISLTLMRLGEYEEALEEIERALALKKDEGRYLWIKADLLENLDRDEEALAVYKEVQKYYPNNPNVYFDIGKSLQFVSGPVEEVLAYYEKTVELDPKHTAVFGKMAELYEELYTDNGDRENYIKAVNSIEKQLENYANCYYYVSQGLIYIDGYEFDKAIEAFKKGMEDNPNDLYTYNNTGYVYKILERYEEAISMYKESINRLKDRETVLPYFNLAVCYLILGKYDEALKAIKKDLELFPRSMKCREFLEEIYNRMNAYDDNIKCLKYDYKEKLIEKDDYYEKLAAVYADKGNHLLAHYYYKRSIACSTDKVSHVLEYAEYLMDCHGKYREALHELMRIQKEVRNSLYDYRSYCRYLSLIYCHFDNKKMAEHYFNEAKNAILNEYHTLEDYFEFPGYMPVRQYMLGQVYVAMGEIDKAEECLMKMTKGHKCKHCHFCECYEALLLKGLIEEKKNNLSLAKEYFTRAYKLQPNDWFVRRKYNESSSN